MLAPQAASPLERLLAPLEPAAFLRDFWEQRHRVLRRDAPDYYADLLAARDVDPLLHLYRWDTLLGSGGVREYEGPPQVTLVRSAGGQADRRPAPTRGGGLLDLGALYEAYADGYTLVVDSLQARWPSVAAFCRALEMALGCPVQANLYVTPRAAQGFAPHFDTHDVFILQLGGAKAWRIYPARELLPLAHGDGRVPPDAAGEPIDEFVLGQGDLLYIPRGYVHEARTTSEASIHLTVGVYVWRWADLLSDAVLVLAEGDPSLRKALPVGALQKACHGLQVDGRVAEILASLGVDSQEIVSRLAGRWADQRQPMGDGHLGLLDQIDAVGSDTRLRRRPDLPCTVSQAGERVTITFPGGSIGGPAFLEEAMRFVARTEVFQVRDLPGPPWAPLSANAQVVLARRLVKAGLLTLDS